MEDFTKRFTGRADVYSKYRPTYPKKIIEILEEEIDFDSEKIVSDIGSGTGILTNLFLRNGNLVYGVEPNDDMRETAESLLHFPKFVSVKGTAENTTLESLSIDLITVGQALHWFDPPKTQNEFRRVAREDGHLCIVYNERSGDEPVMKGYDEIIQRHARNRARVVETTEELLSSFFRNGSFKEVFLTNEQNLDFEGLLGRATSASYMPQPQESEFASVKNEFKSLFDKYKIDGKIKLFYDTKMFLGEV